MYNIVENILLALTVTVINALASWFFRNRLLKRVQGIRMIYGESIITFSSAREAEASIRRECLRSSRIRYIGNYNSTFINARFPQETLLFEILEERVVRHQRECLVQFLHLSPRSKFVDIRARELNYSPDEIRNGVIDALRSVCEVLRQLRISEEKVQVRHYDFQVLLRAIILDNCCFLGFYRRNRMGGFSPIIQVKKGSELYQMAERYFDILWEHFSYPGKEDL